MKKEFNNIAIVVKPNLINSKEFAEEIKNELRKIKLESKIINIKKLNDELKPGIFDLIVAIGGDGTILAISRNIDKRTPILGILIGGRGILSEVIKEEISQAFELLKKKEYKLEEHIRIKISTENNEFPPALNEAYIVREGYNVTPTYNITTKDGLELNQRMDGIMISTPTGSTGHSYTLGSPVIAEDLEAMVITPVCPISLLRPIVLSAGKIEIRSNKPSVIAVDGQEVFKAKENTVIRIDKHEKTIMFLRFSNNKFKQLSKLGFR